MPKSCLIKDPKQYPPDSRNKNTQCKSVHFSTFVDIAYIPKDQFHYTPPFDLFTVCSLTTQDVQNGQTGSAALTVTDGTTSTTDTIRDLSKKEKLLLRQQQEDNHANETDHDPTSDVTSRPKTVDQGKPLEDSSTVPDINIENEESSDDWIDLPSDGEDLPEAEHTLDEITFLSKTIGSGTISLADYIQEQRKDKLLSDIMSDIDNDSKKHPSYLIRDKMLFYKRKNKILIVVPTHILKTLVETSHHNMLSGHSSKSALYQTLSSSYYHPNLRKVVQDVTDACVICKTFRSHPESNDQYRGTQYAEEATKHPRKAYQIDLMAYSKPDGSPTDFHYILVAVEQHSLYTFIIPLKSKSEEEIYTALLSLFKAYGTPSLIRSDAETALRGNFISAKMKMLKIQMVQGSPGNSKSQGIVESRIGRVKMLLRLFQRHLPDMTLHEHIAFASININSQINRHGTSPEQLMFGSSLGNPTALLQVGQSPPKDDQQALEHYKSFLQSAKQARDKIRDKQRSKHNQHRKMPIYEKGQLVYVSRQKLIQGHSGLMLRYQGPMVILARNKGNLTYVLQDLASNKLYKRHFSQLVPCKSALARSFLSPSWSNEIMAKKNAIQNSDTTTVDNDVEWKQIAYNTHKVNKVIK